MSERDDMAAEIRDLKERIEELEAIHGAAEDMKRQIENDDKPADFPFGYDRLRQVKRKEDYPG